MLKPLLSAPNFWSPDPERCSKFLTEGRSI